MTDTSSQAWPFRRRPSLTGDEAARAMDTEKMPHWKIATELNELGFKTPKGAAWSGNAVKRLPAKPPEVPLSRKVSIFQAGAQIKA